MSSIDKLAKGDRTTLALIPSIPQLLARAQYWTSELDRHSRENMAGIHRLVARVELEGQKYNVWLVVREDVRSNKFYYDHRYTKVEKARE
jgi:hypothetical protein